MIRIERGDDAGRGMYPYRCEQYPLVYGKSRQPLLDACRQIKSLYDVPTQAVGLFREGREDIPDLTCSLEIGAATTVSEPDKGVLKFVKYVPFHREEA